MKVVAFNGSARRDGNTAILIREVFKELEKEGIETELVQLAGKNMHGCIACYWNLGIGRDIGEVEGDAEGLQTMRILGRNMAWLLKKLNE